MTDETEVAKITIRYFRATLDSGAEISIGFVEDRLDDESYYFHFKIAEGDETRLRLSHEAVEILPALKDKVDLARNVKAEMRWEVVVQHDMASDSSSVPQNRDGDQPAL